MAVKNLGVLTLDLVEELTQSENNDQELARTKQSSDVLRDKFLALVDQEKGYDQIDYGKHTESVALADQVVRTNCILQPLSDNSFFKQAERQQMEKMNRTSAKISNAFKQEHERKEKLEQDRHEQLISALERGNTQQTLANENAQLKAEIEKLKHENSKLLKENKKIKNQGNIESTRAKNNLLDIIYVLVDMANLPIDNPFKAYGVMELHADGKKLKIPSKDTVSKWLEDAKNKNI